MPLKCDPSDKKLYNNIKKKIYKEIPTHSAYRSGHVVKSYTKAFAKKYSNKKSPYKNCNRKKSSLKRWMDEDWTNQRGKVGYKYKSDVYRPSKRINKHTPLTHKEITNKELKRARRIKGSKGRINRFRSRSRSKKKKVK